MTKRCAFKSISWWIFHVIGKQWYGKLFSFYLHTDLNLRHAFAFIVTETYTWSVRSIAPQTLKTNTSLRNVKTKKICHFQLFDPLHTLSHLFDAQRWEKKHNENRKKARSRIFLFRNVFFADSVFVAKGWKQSWKKEWTNIHLHWHSKKCTNQMISWQSFDSFSQFIIWIFFKQYAHCSKNERIN